MDFVHWPLQPHLIDDDDDHSDPTMLWNAVLNGTARDLHAVGVDIRAPQFGVSRDLPLLHAFVQRAASIHDESLLVRSLQALRRVGVAPHDLFVVSHHHATPLLMALQLTQCTLSQRPDLLLSVLGVDPARLLQEPDAALRPLAQQHDHAGLLRLARLLPSDVAIPELGALYWVFDVQEGGEGLLLPPNTNTRRADERVHIARTLQVLIDTFHQRPTFWPKPSIEDAALQQHPLAYRLRRPEPVLHDAVHYVCGFAWSSANAAEVLQVLLDGGANPCEFANDIDPITARQLYLHLRPRMQDDQVTRLLARAEANWTAWATGLELAHRGRATHETNQFAGLDDELMRMVARFVREDDSVATARARRFDAFPAEPALKALPAYRVARAAYSAGTRQYPDFPGLRREAWLRAQPEVRALHSLIDERRVRRVLDSFPTDTSPEPRAGDHALSTEEMALLRDQFQQIYSCSSGGE